VCVCVCVSKCMYVCLLLYIFIFIFIIQQSSDLIRHLPNASWISIDEEMTGIMLPGNHNNNNNNNNSTTGRPSCSQNQQSSSSSKDEAPLQRYAKFKQIPERYSIIQLGICLFEEREQSRTQRRLCRSKSPTASASVGVGVSAGPSAVDPATFIVVRR
jgi:CAF1 family ribonuclease